MQNRWWIIVNPKAGGARLEKDWSRIAKELREAGLKFDHVITQKPKHAIQLVKDGIQKGYRNIAGIGGDGTNNEIINGIFLQKLIPVDQLKYALLPYGTGNDWSRTHRIPRKGNTWVAMLNRNKGISHNIGKITLLQNNQSTERFFINIVGLSYDAHIVKKAENFSYNSRRRWLYLWLILKELWRFKSPDLKIRFNDKQVTKKTYTLNCGICNYAGGGMKIVPQANPTSDFLGLTIIENFPKWRVPFDIVKLFNGNLEKHKYTSMHTTKLVEVENVLDNNGVEVEADGEYLGIGKVRVELFNKTLEVIVS